MPPPRKFQTDLNHRERTRYVEQLRACAGHFTSAADALAALDDVEAMVNVLAVALMRPSLIRELLVIFEGASRVAQAAEDLERGERP